MVVYFLVDSDGYLSNASSTSSKEDNEVKLHLSPGHEAIRNPDIFKYVEGELIKDEERQKQLLDKQEKEENKPTEEEINEMAILELAMIIDNMKGGN